MSFTTERMIIPVSADAQKKAIDQTNSPGRNFGDWNPTLVIVGLVTTEQVAVQVPRVENPVEATDEHWTPFVQEGVAVVLNADNNVVRIPSAMPLRLVKDAGVSGNEYGVRWV